MPFPFTRPSSPILESDDALTTGRGSQDFELARDMKERPRLEVILDHDPIYLKGTGVDVEPARLSGHVALYLAEATSIKEIKLQFRGKARLPVPANETLSLNNSTLAYVVCNHQWSFLEGDSKHNHTLKAGKHFFPFQLQIGGSLPSSLGTNVLGGANVHYKLRAHAVRSGLNSNLQAAIPVSIIRSFAPEALEYNQTLEIENTWPDKLMYSIVLPHKAWAVGDQLSALVTFSPLAKGTHVLSILTTIVETTKMYARSGAQEHNRIALSIKHDIVDGKAIHLADPDVGGRLPATSSSPAASRNGGPSHANGYFSCASPVEAVSPPTPPPEDVDEAGQNGDVITSITADLPLSLVPSHSLEPIVVSHRVRWSILISNLDGHTSELRCSLPVTILDYRLLAEARLHTAPTRRLLLGGAEVSEAEEQDVDLPSYGAHVRDRIGNMFLPETATMRVSNPWMAPTEISPTSSSNRSQTYSGAQTPLEAHALSHLPHAPGSGSSTPLDWLNSELLLSLSNTGSDGRVQRTPPDSNPESLHTSRSGSRPQSRQASRRGSRRNSPERVPVASPHETHVHEPNFASRSMPGVFNASMKPFTSLAHPHWPGLRSHSYSQVPPRPEPAPRHATFTMTPSATSHSTPTTPPVDVHRALTEVPDYGVASRGFIGGMPPLSSMQGLPSYEDSERTQCDAARSQSESDLASRFGRTHTS